MSGKKTANCYTLGCRLNQAETAIIAKSLNRAGYEIVTAEKSADLTVINTCTVTGQADAKCRQLVRRILRDNPETYVAVVGCYAQLDPQTIMAIKGVDLVIGNENKLNIAAYLNGLAKKDRPQLVHTRKINRNAFEINTYGQYDSSTRANLKIQDGCNFVCSYCIIPKVRGPARSRVFNDILKEARKLVEEGHRELVITGINVGTYVYNGKTLVDVLQALESIEDLARIRISSIEPTTIAEQVVRLMADSAKICPHLHIPLQSGDDHVLKMMRRKYTAKEFADFIESVYKTVPGIGIGTDVMVGFPGESWKSFINTKKLLADLPVSYYHVFTYSDRPGTGSYRMQDKVSPQYKKERNRIMIEQGRRKTYAFYDSFLNSYQDVLFEQKNGLNNWSGYTSNYMHVELPADEVLHNTIRRVKLTVIRNNCLTGALI